MLAGCTSTVGGDAVSAPPDARKLVPLLPNSAQVSDIMGNRLSDEGTPPFVGDLDSLPNGIRDNATANPIDCLGAVAPFMRIVYEKGAVRAAAVQTFGNFGNLAAVSSVNAGIIEFASEAEAQRMFGDFVSRWRACQGTTVTTRLPSADGAELYQQITDVRVDGAVLAATVINSNNGQDVRYPTERALGIASDCAVDIDVAVTNGQAGRRAVELATLMLDRVNQAR
jgi:hypothetical protein